MPAPPAPPPFATDNETHYQLLGIPFTATATEVTRAYRQAMKRVHPDRAGPDRRAEAEEYAKRLNLAHATLSKPEARRAYDETIRLGVVQDQIMSRYGGGVAGPGMEMGGAFGRELRRELTRAERREQALAGRSATATVLIAFVGLAAVIVALLLAFAVVEWAVGAVF